MFSQKVPDFYAVYIFTGACSGKGRGWDAFPSHDVRCGAAEVSRNSWEKLGSLDVAGTAALRLIVLSWDNNDMLGEQNPKWMETFNISLLFPMVRVEKALSSPRC